VRLQSGPSSPQTLSLPAFNTLFILTILIDLLRHL
jgi:hypothetical protein